jgi:carbamoyltransferase
MILALNAYAHNAAAALYDGEHVLAAEQERFDGVRKSGAFPADVIRHVLLPAADAREIDLVAYPWKPRRFAATYLKVFCNDLPRSLELVHPRCSPHLNVRSGLSVLLRLRTDLRRALGGRLPRIRFVEHHLAHAANAFFSSDFDRALILVADAFGDICSLSLFIGEGQRISKVYENQFLDSLGILYSSVTKHLGFRTLYDEGKVMALAGYGEDSLVEEFGRIVRLLPDGQYRLDFSYLNFHHSGEWRPFSRKFERIFGPPCANGEPLTPMHYNLAQALQRTVEDTILHVVRAARGRHGIDRLCFAGGLALNCLVNGRIVREAGLRAVFVPPAPDDSGAVLGAAQAVLHLELGRPRRPVHSAALGPEYTTDRMRAAVPVGRYAVSEPPDVAAKAAELVAEGRIVGWFQGRMEFGPRALGQRSILGDPRRADLQERLNRMKRREAFRPFAPAVLSEHASALLRHAAPSPYMSFATAVEPRLRADIPGALHIDGTARFQTIERVDPSPLRPVVEAFYRATGIPCVVNTSLNCQSPIAATPEDAMACFERADLDAAFLGPYLVRRDGHVA